MDYNLMKALQKPPIYTKSRAAFWDDEYISKQMLKAHLDPDCDAASRKPEFIERSAEWIARLVPPRDYPALLDAGCGPGLYAERFARAGYRVTAVDFSQGSIAYARQSARENGLDISYVCQNYLELELSERFDFATMIYCDYGAMPPEDRKTLLSKLHRHLRPGGRLLLDVFSMKKYREFEERQSWEVSEKDGFWRADAYVALNGYYKYPPNATLDLFTVVAKDSQTHYYIWNTYFTEDALAEEAARSGFRLCGTYGDVAGRQDTAESDTLAVLLERQ